MANGDFSPCFSCVSLMLLGLSGYLAGTLVVCLYP